MRYDEKVSLMRVFKLIVGLYLQLIFTKLLAEEEAGLVPVSTKTSIKIGIGGL